MPKLPPPPRSAQNRSGSDASVTSSTSPVGVDELDGEQVVGGEAVLGHQPAEAAAEREAGDAGRGDRAAGDGEAVLARRGVELRPGHAALRPHGARLRRRRAMPFISARSIITAPSATARPATLWPPPRTQMSSPAARAKRTPAATSAALRQRTISAGRAVDEAVVDAARRVVAGVVRAQDAPRDASGEVVDECGVECHGHGCPPSQMLRAWRNLGRSMPPIKLAASCAEETGMTSATAELIRITPQGTGVAPPRGCRRTRRAGREARPRVHAQARPWRAEPELVELERRREQLVRAAPCLVAVRDRQDHQLVGLILGRDLLEPAGARSGEPTTTTSPATLTSASARNASAVSTGGTDTGRRAAGA